MRVNTYEVDRDGNETLTGENVELIECFGDGAADLEYGRASLEINSYGRFWLGGGAAPLCVIRRVRT